MRAIALVPLLMALTPRGPYGSIGDMASSGNAFEDVHPRAEKARVFVANGVRCNDDGVLVSIGDCGEGRRDGARVRAGRGPGREVVDEVLEPSHRGRARRVVAVALAIVELVGDEVDGICGINGKLAAADDCGAVLEEVLEVSRAPEEFAHLVQEALEVRGVAVPDDDGAIGVRRNERRDRSG